jgi:poly [ADP-ribose] polymerase
MSSTTEVKRYAKLIMVTGENNNKFYEMTYNGGNTFTARYGRVDLTETTVSYPISKWESTYNSKVKKGYQDITSLVAVQKVDNSTEVLDKGLVGKFLQRMLDYSKSLVKSSYTVSTATDDQLNEAQSLINKLSTAKKADEINGLLLRLYTTIPRKMRNVKDHLHPNIDVKTFIDDEQDKLDAMRTTVASQKPSDSKESVLLSEKIGVKITECTSTPKHIEYITKQLKGNFKIFDVEKDIEEKQFTQYIGKYKDQTTRYLMHGTRPSNVISIMSTGLQIRPSNCATFSGKAYGEGNYFSEVAQKSLGYAGYDKDRVLLIYEVFTGKPFVYGGWYKGNSFPLCYKELNKRDYNSTYVKAGGGLLNSEIIVYNESQQKLKHIIWLM